MNKIFIIAQYTFKNIMRSKILIGVGILAVLQFLIAFLTSNLAYGIPIKVTLDFGLGCLTLSSAAIAIFMGSTLISKEIENRTVYITLSRGISRTEFILGKMLGLLGVILVNNFILTTFAILSLLFFNGNINAFTFVIIGFICIESVLCLIFTILFSLHMNPILTVICSLSTYISGHALHELLKIESLKSNLVIYYIVKIFSIILPNLNLINYRDFSFVTPLPTASVVLTSFSYAFLYSLALIFFVCVSFQNKELE